MGLVDGQRMIDSRASVQVGEARTCRSIADEARIYLLVNSGGGSQTRADLDNARCVATAAEPLPGRSAAGRRHLDTLGDW